MTFNTYRIYMFPKGYFKNKVMCNEFKFLKENNRVIPTENSISEAYQNLCYEVICQPDSKSTACVQCASSSVNSKAPY